MWCTTLEAGKTDSFNICKLVFFNNCGTLCCSLCLLFVLLSANGFHE
jgi:hypothetical protein